MLKYYKNNNLLLSITKKKKVKKEINLLNNNKIFAYICGPTVYNDIHIGNCRSLLFSYLFLNFLKIIYDKKIIIIQNFTDIDEKIIKKSQIENITYKKITNNYIDKTILLLKKFNIFSFNNVIIHRPKTTNYIKDIQIIINELLDNKKAYVLEDGIYLNISNIDFFFRKKEYIKKDDFCLWKFRNKFGWKFNNKLGIPGWHIECFAMCRYFLNKYNINIINFYFGGSDLIFPHHENANIFFNLYNYKVDYWLHNGMLQINKNKMSKSKNNIVLVKDLLLKYSPDCIKLFLLSNAFYKNLNFDYETLENYNKILKKINNLLNKYQIDSNLINNKEYILNNKYFNEMLFFLNNNFNIQGVIGYIIKNLNKNVINIDFINSIFFFFKKILLI